MAAPAPACRRALEDATARWPKRTRASDGIMGDARHQKSKSDHNLGNAVDITHDPSVGCDGSLIAALAIRDSRVTYVIWNRRIYSRARAREGWRRYRGSNPHTHHCHISISASARSDTRAWAWAPSAGALPALTTLPAVPAAPTGASASRAPTSSGASYGGVPLRVGMRGELVRRMQQQLKKTGWDIDVDGVFGGDTDRVVRAFQRRRGLEDDGIVGRKTWQALFA